MLLGRILALGALLGSFALSSPPPGRQQGKDLIETRSAEPTGQALYTESHALIVGINKYPNLPRPLQLQYAEKDANDMRDMLVNNYGFDPAEVTVLTNEKATLSGIRSALSKLASSKTVKADDRILIYFSGHGQTVKLPTGGEMGFLIPSDAKIDMNDPTDAGPYLETCLPMRQVWDYLSSSPAKHAAVIADACFSGMLVSSRSVSMNSDTVKAMLARPARQAMTAGAMGQKTFERSDLGHGVFTYKLLEELKVRSADKGKVFSLMDIYMSLQNSVSNATGGKQIPQFGSYETEGQMLFCSGSMLMANSNPNGGTTGGTSGGTDPGNGKGPTEAPATTRASVTITTVPPGANLWIDGQKKGSTPYMLQADLKGAPEKEFRVRLEMKGYIPAETSVTLHPGDNTDLPVSLKEVPVTPPPPTTAAVTIESNPPGAMISINGKRVGTAPYVYSVDLKKKPQESIRVRAELAGYVATETSLTAKRGDVLTVPMELKLVPVKTDPPKDPIDTKPPVQRHVKTLALSPLSTLSNNFPVANVSFSPDGKWLASTGLDYSLTLFDVRNGSSAKRIAAPKNTMVRITPDWSQILFVRLLTDGSKTWASVEVKDAETLASKKTLKIDLHPGSSLNDVYAGKNLLILTGTYPSGGVPIGFCAAGDFAKGEATIFSSGYRIRSATGSKDGSTYAVYVEPTDLRSPGSVVVLSKDLSQKPRQIVTEDCNNAAGLVLSEDGETVGVTCQRTELDGSTSILGTKLYATASGEQVQFLPKLRAASFVGGNARLLGWRTQIGGPIVELLDVKSGNGLGETTGTQIWLSDDQKLAAQTAPDGTISVFRLNQP